MDKIDARNLVLVFMALVVAQVFIGGAFLIMENRKHD